MFVLREAFRSIRRSPTSVLLIALVIGVGIGLTAVFGLVAYSAHKALADVERSLTIEIFFDEHIGDDEARAIFDHDIATDKELIIVQFISKEDALAEYQAGTGQDVRSVLGENPLPAGARVRLEDPSPAKLDAKIAKLEQVAGVAEVLSDRELERSLSQKADLLDELTLWLGGLIGLVILVVVGVSTRLAVEIRRQALSVMRLLGASTWRVSAPFILEGAIAGLLGGGLAVAILAGLSEMLFSAMIPDHNAGIAMTEIWTLAAVILISGAILGMLGSALSVVPRIKRN